MDVKTLSIMIMTVSLVAVHGKYREQGNQLQRLAQHIGDGDVVSPIIIGIQSQNAAARVFIISLLGAS